MTDERLLELFEALLENRLAPSDAERLSAELRSSSPARQLYWNYVEQHALIADILGETRGRDLALLEGGNPLASPATGEASPTGPGRHRRRWALVGPSAAVAAGLLLAAVALGPKKEFEGALAPLPESVPLGTVYSLVGQVQVVDSDGSVAAATPGFVLGPGQALRVGGDESQSEVRFPDGTRVTINSDSTVRFAAPGAGEGKRCHLEQGAMHVRSPAQPTDRPLIVTTDHTRISALETRFRVYREADASRVELEVGTVRLDSPTDGRSVQVPEGFFVVVGDGPKPMVPESLAGGQCRLRCTLMKAGDAVALSRDGTALATAHRERGLRVWNTRDGSLRGTAEGHGRLTTGLAFSPAGDTVIALGDHGTAASWKIGEPRARFATLREKEIRDSSASGDGRWFAQALRTGEVAVWEWDPETGTGTLRQSLPHKPSRVALSATGSHVAVSRWGGEIHILDVKTGKETAQYKMKRTPTPVALFADGRYVAAYANDDGLALFDRTAGLRRTLWAGEGARVAHLSFSDDGRMLFAGLEDGTVRGWSTADGRARLVLETGHRRVNKVTATPDLSLLATVGDGDCVKLWECKLP